MPASQLTQVLDSDAPDGSEAVPAEQVTHVAAPEELEKDPGEHAVHELAADAEYEPAAHRSHPAAAALA